MHNYTLTPLETLVITQYVTLMHLCYHWIAISLIQVTSINLFPPSFPHSGPLYCTLQTVRKTIN